MTNFFKENLKYIREEKGLSQNKLSELTGVNQSTIGRWESGEMTPTIDNVIDLMNALHIPINELGNFLGKNLSIHNINEEKQETTEQEEMELLKNTLQRKGFLNENEEMTKEDFDKLMDFAKANKQFIMKDTEERK